LVNSGQERRYCPGVLVSSRSFAEYRAFFGLTANDVAHRRILDCAAGASSFTFEANERGGRVVAIDPGYADPEALVATARSSVRAGAAVIAENAERFTWAWYGSAESRALVRARALAAFVRDFGEHPRTYLAGRLPQLPLADDCADLALSSHLLFTWADVLDEQWHAEALAEMLRVAPEARVFPLVVRGKGDRVVFLAGLLDRMRDLGHGVEVRRVGYELQRGAHRMLVITRSPNPGTQPHVRSLPDPPVSGPRR
jgi:hypothetical protein